MGRLTTVLLTDVGCCVTNEMFKASVAYAIGIEGLFAQFVQINCVIGDCSLSQYTDGPVQGILP
jgi:hypothetical protein